MKSVLLKGFGKANQMYVGQTAIPTLRQGEVLIAIKATAVNRADIVQRSGHYPPPPGESEVLGLEASGIVVKTSDHDSKFKKGDRVMALMQGGSYAEFAAVPESLLMPIPSQMTYTEAACIPEAWVTAYQLIHKIAHMKPTDNVLIHAGASGVGTAAIQLAALHQTAANVNNTAKVIATSTTVEKLEFCRQYGANALIHSKQENWADQVIAATGGHGADVILDCVGASFFEGNSKAIAKDGRWVNYAFLGGYMVPEFNMRSLFAKRATLAFTTLRSRDLAYRSDLVRGFSSFLPRFVGGENCLRVVKDMEFDLENVADAHEYVEANKNIGKVVIRVDPNTANTCQVDLENYSHI